MNPTRTGARTSRIQCCVVGCRNAYYNTDTSIKFYSSPKRWFEKERKQTWINSVSRVCADGTSGEWQPKEFHKICSAHFVGNAKSNDPSKPSYNPTIFPQEYERKDNSVTDNSTEKKERCKRKIARSKRKNIPKEKSPQSPCPCDDESLSMKVDEGKKEFSSQTEPSDLEEIFLFESNFMGHSVEGRCDVTTQCNIADKTKLFS
ncbi:uncharacterized protein LOC123675011 [Harmonia axyridis]|uniref:uncharacterized protein LOC123675011 n=1 Tax=Harmonia axyridis TaxID=115357 RepID=UPI001E278DB4|nr:uncharacterized protein LOC123675011 [Harmonia axyridis]